MSVDNLLRNEYIDPKRAAMKDDYKHYVSELNNSLKNKKSRYEFLTNNFDLIVV